MFAKILPAQSAMFVVGLLTAGFLYDVKWNVLARAVGVL